MLGAMSKIDMSKITKKLGRYNIALISNNISLKAIDLLESYRLNHGLLLPDSIIAATALITDLELYTYNTKILSLFLA